MTPTDRCQYCGHTRAEHNRPEPGNPPPSLRCARGCVCPAFIEKSGKPDYLELSERRQRTTTGDKTP